MSKSITVNMPAFTIEAAEYGRVVNTISECSFGRDGHRTPIIANGSLSLTKRDKIHHSTLYHNALMRHALFFEQDPACAFHEGDTRVASHGCIHLNGKDAEWLFNWAGHDPVSLHMKGPYPVPPVRAKAEFQPESV